MPKASSGCFKVFVYGTLKEGFPNFYLNQGIKQDGEFVTELNYLFYLMGDRHTPCLYEHDNKGTRILGELYHVNQEDLDVLDKLERTHEKNGYIRTLINIINEQSDITTSAYIYFKNTEYIDQTKIKLGPINCYNSEHSKLYQYRKKT